MTAYDLDVLAPPPGARVPARGMAAVLLLLLLGIAPTASAQCVPPSCDDNNLCTTDSCCSGSCSHIVTVMCNDGNACTIDACDPVTGVCQYVDVVTPTCNDANVCTNDACNPVTGVCMNTPIICDDGNACTMDACDPVTGVCQHFDIVTPTCNDANVCTIDECNPVTGVCMITLFTCHDLNPCTVDACNPQNGLCQHIHNCVDLTAIAAKVSANGSSVVFKRKQGQKNSVKFTKVTLKDVIVTSTDGPPVRHTLSLKSIVTGADQPLTSLLYPVAVLGMGAGALDALQAQGYDVSVVDAGALVCQDELSPAACTDLALQLSKTIDGVLALGNGAERDAFRQGVQSLGYPPDTCFTPE